MSVLATLRRGLRENGIAGAATVARYYAARFTGMAAGPGRQCPLCGKSTREFYPLIDLRAGVIRNGAVCPSCGALERHRAYARFYQSFIPAHFRRPVDVLHAAPEEALAGVFGALARRYDLSDYESPPPGHIQLDLCAPHLEAASYDVIVLNHVLTCIPEDRLVARNMAMLLRPGGVVLAGEVVHPGRVTTSRDRPGYGGRVHEYGALDVATRFEPFTTEVVDVAAGLSASERKLFGIADVETMIVMRAPGTLQPSPSDRS